MSLKPASVGVTVVIAVHNEAANISACIDSVRWAREIIVVENDSTDGTANLALEAGATVIRNPFVTIGGQRNAAIERASNEWILAVDADERGSAELGSEIAALLAAPGVAAGPQAFRVPRRNFLMGREIRYGGWQTDRPVRFFHRGLRYNASRVHEHVEVSGPTGVLASPLLHAPYATIDQYFEKLDRYSEWWALDRVEKGRRASAFSVVAHPPLRFLKMYVLRRGFMDGAAGAVLACMAAASVVAKYARLWWISQDPRAPFDE